MSAVTMKAIDQDNAIRGVLNLIYREQPFYDKSLAATAN